MIPGFDRDGFLPVGVWNCSGQEFLERFAAGRDRGDFRSALINVLDFGAHYGALSVLVGGSFITTRNTPNDIDCVIVFSSEEQIPPRIESLEIGNIAMDIFFTSVEQEQVLLSFLKLFTTDRYGVKRGAINVELIANGNLNWDINTEPDDLTYNIVRKTYIRRHIVDKNPKSKTLVTIHGIRSYGEWNAELTLCASASGWLVAPFQYGYVDASVLLRRKGRRLIVDRFRDFLIDLTKTFEAKNISVIAHSFGTYVICNYILGFDNPPVQFDSLIMCGAIIDETLDLDLFQGRVANILNEQAPNDEWVEWAKKANLGQDELFGYAGTRGFSKQSGRLLQKESQIFTHGNVIKRDVIIQRWLPFLEANKGSVYREQMQDVFIKATNLKR